MSYGEQVKSARTHEGRVAVSRSDLRWCSDGLAIKCDSGQTVTAAFAEDCCDREVLAWRAWEGKRLPGEPVREMLIEAVERRFGSVEAVPQGQELEFLSDNGGAYIAAETRALARALGLKPINTPVCSPQSNGMAESFVNTFKRDYVARMDLSDAQTVLAQLPAAFEHFNEVHPHSSLKMRSPREFRRQQAARAAQVLYCEQGGVGNRGETSQRVLQLDLLFQPWTEQRVHLRERRLRSHQTAHSPSADRACQGATTPTGTRISRSGLSIVPRHSASGIHAHRAVSAHVAQCCRCAGASATL